MLFRQGSCLRHGHNLLRVAWRAPHGRGRTRPALPLRRPTRDRCPLASNLLHNNTASFARFTLIDLSSLIYSTCTFVDSDDIIYFTLANNYFSLSTQRTHHPHDRPPNCGERTGEITRTKLGNFRRSASHRGRIYFSFISFFQILLMYCTLDTIKKIGATVFYLLIIWV